MTGKGTLAEAGLAATSFGLRGFRPVSFDRRGATTTRRAFSGFHRHHHHHHWERAKGATKASCGETVVQKGVFGESVSSPKTPFWTTVSPHDAFAAPLAHSESSSIIIHHHHHQSSSSGAGWWGVARGSSVWRGSRSLREITIQNASCQMGGREVTR